MTPPNPDNMNFSEKLGEILSDMAFRCAGGITDDGKKEYLPAHQAIIELFDKSLPEKQNRTHKKFSFDQFEAYCDGYDKGIDDVRAILNEGRGE